MKTVTVKADKNYSTFTFTIMNWWLIVSRQNKLLLCISKNAKSDFICWC